jgi:hypothetical protein
MVKSSSVDPDEDQKCIKYLKNRPDMKVPEAMKQTNFSVDQVADLSLHRFIQRSLPGKTLKGEGSEGARIGISSAATAAT